MLAGAASSAELEGEVEPPVTPMALLGTGGWKLWPARLLTASRCSHP